MRLAIVHEWFSTYAGSERVVEQMLHEYPQADLFALVDFLESGDRAFLQNKPVQTSFIQRLPRAKKSFRNYLPLMPTAIEQFDMSAYDVVLSSNHAVAKGVITGPDQLHVCYVHSPIRYAWDMQHQYLREANLTSGIKSLAARMILHYVRLWDYAAAGRVDAFIANSRYIARRIRRTYRRSAEVVYPPVDVEGFAVGTRRESYYLAASRLVPYKRMDLIVDAFARMPERRLVVIGDGPEMPKLKAKATPNVELLGYQSTTELRRMLGEARAFVFAAEEDFGIAPVEAMACGTPVIAFGRGGATETVLDGKTGIFFNEQTPNSVRDAVLRFEKISDDFDSHCIRARAELFSRRRFRLQLRQAIDGVIERHKDSDTTRDQSSGFASDERLADADEQSLAAAYAESNGNVFAERIG